MTPQEKKRLYGLIDELPLPELNALQDHIIDLIEFRKKDAILTVQEQMHKLIESSGLSPGDFYPSKPKRIAGTISPAKYRSPNGETWTGHGRPPNWVKTRRDAGEDMSRYLINNTKSETPTWQDDIITACRNLNGIHPNDLSIDEIYNEIRKLRGQNVSRPNLRGKLQMFWAGSSVQQHGKVNAPCILTQTVKNQRYALLPNWETIVSQYSSK